MRPRALRHLRYAALVVAALAMLWLVGLWRFAATLPRAAAEPDQPTDAIVVLTGGSQRVEGGLHLLAEGKAKKLFISGVYRGVDVAELLRVSRQSPDSVACCIVLGHAAADTVGNARETARGMAQEGFHSLRLVTASYHMPRSLLEFTRAMPDKVILPYPVFPEPLRDSPWWRSRTSTLLIAGEYTKYIVALMRPVVLSPFAALGAGD